MPRRNTLTGRLLRHLLLISVASCVLNVFSRGWDEWDERKLPEPKHEPEPEPVAEAAAAPKRKRRLAGTVSFCVLFFAGLALSAGAGNGVRALLEDGTTTDTTTATDTTLTETLPAASAQPVVHATQLQARERPSVSQTPATLSVKPTTSHRFTQTAQATQRTGGTRSTLKQQSARRLHPAKGTQAHTRHTAKARRHSNAQPLDAEANSAGATVWLYRAAVDPTPPAARLRVSFARELVRDSRQAHVDWALVLAMLRANGHNGRAPATRAELRSLTFRLAGLGGATNPWAAALSYSSETSTADRVVALRHYYRAVGLASLVYGLLSQKRDLEDRVLHDSRISIYAGGRNDVAAHKVDVRVLAVMLYLADTFHQVTVSCLISGHRLYARPGVISAHIYGRAADIASLGGVSIYGHQQPGGVTERAVRALLMLPGGMLPQQIISLLGLGGPSFPLANHYDHIHVGF
jgi:hypothetical protein